MIGKVNRLKHLTGMFLIILSGSGFCYSQTHFTQPVINRYSRVTDFNNVNPADSDTIEINDPQYFTTGDRVIIMVMKGAEIYTPQNLPGFPNFWGKISNIHNTGYYSVHTISEISGNLVMLSSSFPAIKKGVEGEIIQLIRVPEVLTAILDSSVTCQAWDPVTGTGGVLALFADNKIVINKGIDVTGKGFKGADPTNDYFKGECSVARDTFYLDDAVNSAGKKGEGIVFAGFSYTRGLGYAANAGGGGNGRFSGGAGGGQYGTGGQGGKESENCSPIQNYGGNGRYIPSGFFTNTDTYKNRAYLGGGGGCSTQNPDSSRIATRGGNGGGIVILITDTLTTYKSTTIRANGESVTDTATAGGSGGGGAGMIILDVKRYEGEFSLRVRGGNGGFTSEDELTGPGGFGGGGFIWFSGDSLPDHVSVDTLNGSAGLNALTNSTRGAITSSVRTGSMTGNLVIPMAGNLFNTLSEKHVYCGGVVDQPLPATAPKGGNGIYTFEWIQSDDQMTWTTADGGSDQQDYLPQADADTMYYRRIITSAGTSDTSNIIQMILLPDILNNQIMGGGTVCDNESPGELVQDGPEVSGGAGSFSYKWEIRGTLDFDQAPGVNTMVSYFPPQLSINTKLRRVVYSDQCKTYSNEVEFVVDKLPWFIRQPEADTIDSQSTNVFSVQAEGTAPLSYQWYFDETEIDAGTNPSYAIVGARSSQSGNYYCRVSNNCGSVYSDTAVLYVIPGLAPDKTFEPDYTVNIFPNPATNYILIQTDNPEPFKVEFYNLLGEKIIEAVNQYMISTGNLSEGIYIVRCFSNTTLVSVNRLVIK
ncbi:MAG: T9SS type A sorting domain-containing protein [Bacteroidales bacterium]|nr:T9SS type A sorting domain-containing protein [Bacteroidales bacterium]